MKIGIRAFFLTIVIVGSAIFNPLFATDAGLLPNAVQQFFDNNGNPLTSGTVTTYQAGTSTLKTTWRDSAGAVANTNPIRLDGGGKAIIYGEGTYRQVVKDRNNNLIWDAVTAPGGGGSTPTAVGDGLLVGSVLPWSGLTAPNQYVFAYGQGISRATFPEFFTAITQQLTVICTSASNTLTGVSDTTQVKIGSPVELSACVTAGTTVVSKTASTIVLSNPSSVSINATATFFPWGNGDGSTTFNVPDFRGYVMAGRDNMGGTAAGILTQSTASFGSNSPDALGATGGTQNFIISQSNLPNITLSTLIASGQGSHVHSVVTSTGAGVGTNVRVDANGATPGAQNTVAATLPAMTGTTNTGGSSVSLSVVQPTITVNYIVKVTPDTSTSIATGVFSIGGMTGTIACSTGVICTGNNISVSLSGGGGVDNGLINELAYYAAAGDTISGLTTGNNGILVTSAGGVPSISSTIPNATQDNITRTGTLVSGATGAGFTVALGTSTITGTLNVNRGGTGNTTFTANLPLIGNTTNAISQGTLSGNTTKFVTTTGTLTNGNCVSIDASGNFIDAGGACTTGGGGGTVNAGTTSQLAYYVSNGTAVSGLATGNNGVLITSGTGVPSISSTIPSATQDNITRTGTLVSGSTGAGFTVALSTATITGNLSVSRLNSGTGASATTAWFGDGTWKSALTSITCGTGLSGGVITTSGTCSLTTPVVASLGGTGQTSLTPHGVVIGNGTGAVAITSAPSTGQCLIGNGASADPAFTSGCWTLLNTLTASASASLSDTTSLTSTYNRYLLVFTNIIPATNSVTCQFKINSGGVQSTNYLNNLWMLRSSNSTNVTSATTFVQCSDSGDLGNTASLSGLNGSIEIIAPSGTASRKIVSGKLNQYNAAGTALNILMPQGVWTGGVGAITGFELTMSSGNITSGNIKIYGAN